MEKQVALNLTTVEILKFTSGLTTYDYRKLTKRDIKKLAKFVCSDGCTGVPEFYRESCIVHDFWYRTHRDLDGSEITKAEADRRMRVMIQDRSPAGVFSPMSWWRWAGVKLFASKAWAE